MDITLRSSYIRLFHRINKSIYCLAKISFPINIYIYQIITYYPQIFSQYMGARSAILIFAIIVAYIVYHREHHLHSQQVHSSAEGVQISENTTIRPYYAVGPYKAIDNPSEGLANYFSRKRINSFIFNHYNRYRIQLSFVDLGYASELIVKLDSQESQLYVMHEKIGFTLDEQFLPGTFNLDVNKTKFKLSVRQYINEQQDITVTTFNLTSHRKFQNLTLGLTQMTRNKECLTAIRANDIISHKCYGGIGAGKVRLEKRVAKPGEPTVSSNTFYNLGFNLTRCSFDGLRGSNMHWNWIWAEASGFSKPYFYANGHKIQTDKFIGLNFGSINNQGEDFAFLSGDIVPLQGVDYTIDEKSSVGTNITFTSSSPRMEAKFTINEVQILKKDTGIFLVDMVIFHGVWAGWIEDKNGQQIGFYEIVGIVETCDSFF